MKSEIDTQRFLAQEAVPPLATILIIEDNKALLELETFHLRQAGYEVIGLSFLDDMQTVLSQKVDLMLIDCSAPDTKSKAFVSSLRANDINTPVIFLSDTSKEEDVEEGFRCGGDDYMTKPLNIKELLYRIKAILKRTHDTGYEKLKVRDIVMDFSSRRTFVRNAEVMLTKLEFKLLSMFLKNKNKVLERNYLLQHIWKDTKETQKRTINVTINRLRKKIDPMNEKNYIIPVRGIGYKFH